jgi:hypothetical protein
MAKAVVEIEDDIRALSAEERRQLLRDLIAELDAPADKESGRRGTAPSDPENGFGMVKLESRGKPRRLSDFDAADLLRKNGAA